MTKIFETDRLIIRKVVKADADDYFDMMGNPNVMSLIPTKVLSKEESNNHLERVINSYQQNIDDKIWGIETKSKNEFIGLCFFTKNNKKEDEIGYRLREKFWRKGYGTEITKGLISFGFNEMDMTKITADVAVNNTGSVKILEKFMVREDEFLNEKDGCIDRRYAVMCDDNK